MSIDDGMDLLTTITQWLGKRVLLENDVHRGRGTVIGGYQSRREGKRTRRSVASRVYFKKGGVKEE